jgi:hypothetical protein
MALSFSTFIKSKWLASASGEDCLAHLIAGCHIAIMKGARPTNADTACLATNLLATIDTAATHLLFNAECTAGVMSKKTGDIWSDTSVDASGDALWFRLYMPTEDYTYEGAGTGATLKVIDGTVGETGDTGVDLYLAEKTLVAGQVLTIDVFQITLP